MIRISIAHQFSDVPLGRVPTDGEFCGENFREKFLLPALRQGQVVVDFDGLEGLGSSFLDEAFGGLVRRHGFSVQELRERLKVVTTERPFLMYVDLVWRYLQEAAREQHLAA